ncbi:MAG: hypothetical protein Kow0075_03970 [Salibacteraceae bacterium]
MMKVVVSRVLSVLLLGVANWSIAQSNRHAPNNTTLVNELGRQLQLAWQVDLSLVEIARGTSPTGVHTQYAIYHNGYPIIGTCVKVHQRHKGTSAQMPRQNHPITPHPLSELNQLDRLDSLFDTGQRDTGFVITGNDLHPILIFTDWAEIKRWAVNPELGVFALPLGANVADTSLAGAFVFKPDPLTTARQAYGGIYVDSNDRNQPWLIDALFEESIVVTKADGSEVYELKNEFVMAGDISAPAILPPSGDLNAFRFTRDISGFEYVNAYYHITEMAKRMNTLGFPDLPPKPAYIDAYAFDGEDQSSFVPYGNDLWILFGQGGVDDAEDADVVVHEYGHALIFSASPNTNFGHEREAVDEALCDYMALSYSWRTDPYNSRQLFNWDGHNEFWNGRSVLNNATYPEDLKSNIYADGLILASALYEAMITFGPDVCDALVAEAAYYLMPGMGLQDAAGEILSADSLLFGAEHATGLWGIFCHRGLLKNCPDNSKNALRGKTPVLGMTHALAQGQSSFVRLYRNQTEIISIEIISPTGTLVYSAHVQNPEAYFQDISLNGFAAGVYLVRVLTDQGWFTFKALYPGN